MDQAARPATRGGAPPVYPDAWREARPGRATRALQAAAPALLLLAGALLPPDRPFPVDLCLWHRLTGFACLGCGLTRSVCHLMHGDIAGSLSLHPAGVVVVAIAAVLAARGARDAVRGFGLTRRG
jgi:hypothetical protein